MCVYNFSLQIWTYLIIIYLPGVEISYCIIQAVRHQFKCSVFFFNKLSVAFTKI